MSEDEVVESVQGGHQDRFDSEGKERKSLKDARILVADDDVEIRGMLVNCFQYWGVPSANIAEADDGLPALESFREAQRRNQPFDLVVTDGQMRKMNGTELIKAIRKIESVSGKKQGSGIWLLSASDEGKFPAETRAEVEFFPKPIDVDELEQKLTQRFSGEEESTL